ncbi:MAG: cupin domain-containing protein [Xanthobacteraceae bacterium]
MLKQIITASPVEIELGPSPFPDEWVLVGRPQARAKEIARSHDGTMRVIVWSCSQGQFRWQYLVDEMLQVLSGEVFITDHTDTERRLGPGDTAFFPAGCWSVWRVTQDVRKVAVCHVPVPRAVGFALRAWNWLNRSLQTQLGLRAGPTAAPSGLLGQPSDQEVAAPAFAKAARRMTPDRR